jgi:hypothetical protein
MKILTSTQSTPVTTTSNINTKSSTAPIVNSNHATALNKVIWTEDGRKLVVGDSCGVVHMIGVRASVVELKNGEEDNLELTLQYNNMKLSSSALNSVSNSSIESKVGVV